MPETVVRCSKSGCDQLASGKIAAPWSDGRFSELKTFGFACSAHADDVKDAARKRLRQYKPSAEESIGEIGVYGLT